MQQQNVIFLLKDLFKVFDIFLLSPVWSPRSSRKKLGPW